ncbi:hypothetical protein [Microbispora sp. H11081]|uniref:hypothetical protein n=1 Tax=Microbispora sp. H11081 TaxID=2729107 RepID=UPI0028A01A5F|nr:hypothetical protein [Microbispora sp. H11081]
MKAEAHHAAASSPHRQDAPALAGPRHSRADIATIPGDALGPIPGDELGPVGAPAPQAPPAIPAVGCPTAGGEIVLHAGKTTASYFWDDGSGINGDTGAPASGKPMQKGLAASPSWPMGTKGYVVYKGKKAEFFVGDRGPGVPSSNGIMLDLDGKTFAELTGGTWNSRSLTVEDAGGLGHIPVQYVITEWGEGLGKTGAPKPFSTGAYRVKDRPEPPPPCPTAAPAPAPVAPAAVPPAAPEDAAPAAVPPAAPEDAAPAAAPPAAPEDAAPASAPEDAAPAAAPPAAPEDAAPASAPEDAAPASAPEDAAPASAPEDAAPASAPGVKESTTSAAPALPATPVSPASHAQPAVRAQMAPATTGQEDAAPAPAAHVPAAPETAASKIVKVAHTAKTGEVTAAPAYTKASAADVQAEDAAVPAFSVAIVVCALVAVGAKAALSRPAHAHYAGRHTRRRR